MRTDGEIRDESSEKCFRSRLRRNRRICYVSGAESIAAKISERALQKLEGDRIRKDAEAIVREKLKDQDKRVIEDAVELLKQCRIVAPISRDELVFFVR